MRCRPYQIAVVRFTPHGPAATMTLSVSNVGYAYPSSGRGVSHVNLRARRGRLTALVGRTGCGKTTLLACIAGLLVPKSGTITYEGSRLRSWQCASLFLQAPLFARLTVWENVSLAHGGPRRTGRAQTLPLLDYFQLTPLADALPGRLTQGECRRVALAATLALDRPVTLLDEPTRGLDENDRRIVIDQLTRHALRDGVTVIATHDLKLIEECRGKVSIDP